MAFKGDKQSIRTYYETHFYEVKDVAEKFKISARTLYDWIKKEDWKQGRFAKTGNDVIQSELVQTAMASKLDYVKQSVARQIKQGFDELGVECSDDIVQTRADEMLLEAMSASFINKSMAEIAVLAKANLKQMVNHGVKPEKIISASKDVMNVYATLKQSIHGKEPTNVINIANFNSQASMADMASLSDDELRNLIIETETKDE